MRNSQDPCTVLKDVAHEHRYKSHPCFMRVWVQFYQVIYSVWSTDSSLFTLLQIVFSQTWAVWPDLPSQEFGILQEYTSFWSKIRLVLYLFFRETVKSLFSWKGKIQSTVCDALLEVKKVNHRLWYYLLHQEWGSCIPAECGAAGREWYPSGPLGSSRTARGSSSQTVACGSTWDTDSIMISMSML